MTNDDDTTFAEIQAAKAEVQRLAMELGGFAIPAEDNPDRLEVCLPDLPPEI